MTSGPAPRWPVTPEQPLGLGERLILFVVAAGVATAIGCWLVAEIAALLGGHGPVSLSPSEIVTAMLHLPGDLADPRKAWPPSVRAELPGPGGFYAAAAIFAAGLGVLGFAAARLVRRVRDAVRPTLGARDRADAARWATTRDLRTLRVRTAVPGRLTLGRARGRLIAGEAGQSAIVIAPTQSLKTSGLAIPAILEWPGPVLATSVKTDLLRHTIARRRQLGDVLFDPSEATGLDANGWTPLTGCQTWQGAQRTAATLCATAKPGGATLADADFWYAAAAKLLAPLLFAAATVAEGSIADVVRWTDTQEVDEVRDALEQAGVEQALQAAQATWQRDERQRSSIYTTAETVLAAYSDPGVLAAAYMPDLTPERLLDGSPTTAYLCAPSHEQQRLRPLFATLIEQVLAAVYERAAATGRPLDPPLLLVLDEAANIAAIPSLDTIAATAAGQGIQLVSVFQDLAQIKERYGTRALTIVNNHRAKLIGSGIADPDTLDYAARVLGDHEIQQISSTAGQEGRASTTQSTTFRALAPPHALRQAEPGSALLIYGSLPPVRIRLRPWFSERSLRGLATPDAEEQA